jgi:hypothetical protein
MELLERDEYTALGAWAYGRLRAEFDTDPIREGGLREEDQQTGGLVYQIAPRPVRRFSPGGPALVRFGLTVYVMRRASSSWPLGPESAAIRAALDGKKNEAIQGGYLLSSCVRESPYAPPAQIVFKGVEFRQLGSVFGVQIQ